MLLDFRGQIAWPISTHAPARGAVTEYPGVGTSPGVVLTHAPVQGAL